MYTKEFLGSLQGETTKTLLEILELGQTGKEKIDPDVLDAIIEELYSRELTEKEKHEFDYLILCIDESVIQSGKGKKEFSKAEKEQLITNKSEDKELNKYKSLKRCTGLFSFLGYTLFIIGIILLIALFIQEQYGMGIIGFISSFVIALLLLAFSDLIHVFIDIEYNTRNLSKKK